MTSRWWAQARAARRLAGIELLSYTSGPTLGNARYDARTDPHARAGRVIRTRPDD